MELHTLEYFVCAARLQHITRAAAQLHVAQPSLSRTIAGLEAELGVPLFDRTGKNIVLNQYGQVVLHHAQRILQEAQDIRDELADLKDEGRRTVSISLRAASKLLPQVVLGFKREYPSIRLHILQDEGGGSELPCDLTLYSSLQPCEGPHQAMLMEEEILLALPETNPLVEQPAVDLRRAAGEEFICLQRGKSLRTITDFYCRMAGFEPTVVMESDSPETVRELIGAGVGISFIPSVTWGGLDTAHIALRPISFPACRRFINLSWREGYLSPAAILFRDYVRRFFAALRPAPRPAAGSPG